ncbi:hypothetical protein [Phocaeicola massiliensis]|uniref:hypothetical protein n=1 Tax=Phocaeicola massiliensis TaxID=204516 RepID=UPI0032ECF3C5
MSEREYIEFLESLTRFVFDKSVFKRIATKRGLIYMSYEDVCIDEEKSEMCEIDLLELVVKDGPNSVASSSIQHGNFRRDIGSEDITDSTLKRVKDRLDELYKKYGIEDKLASNNRPDMEWYIEDPLCG